MATIAAGAAPASAGRAPTSSPVTEHIGRIAFSAYHGGVQQVFTMKEDGTGRTQITFNKTGDKKCDPVLSNDGKEVAYAANDGGMYIHKIGGAALNVAPPVEPGMARGGGRRPAWSPDGNTVVFGFSTNWNNDLTPDAEAVFDLWMVSRESGGLWNKAIRVTNVNPGASAYQPRFNTEGTWMSYTFRDAGVLSADADLYVAPSKPRPTPSATGVQTIGHVLMAKAGAQMSTWRADGKQIGFVKSCTGGIHVANITYEPLSKAPTSATAVAQPLVSSGGCGLSFSRTEANKLTYADSSSKIYVMKSTVDAQDNDVWGTPVSIGIGSQPSW